HPLFLEQRRDALPEQYRVVGEDDAQHLWAGHRPWKRRELAVEAGHEDPPEAGRLRDSLEGQLTEVLALVLDLDRAGGEDLATTGGLADARCLMNGEPDVPVAGDLRPSAMNAHPHPERNRPVGRLERELGLHGRPDGVAGPLERGEELVA